MRSVWWVGLSLALGCQQVVDAQDHAACVGWVPAIEESETASAPLVDGSCGCWEGDASANDPEMQVRIEVCVRGSRAEGTVTFVGEESGTSVRAVEGDSRASGFVLHDTELLVDSPHPTWMFCPIDEYRFDLAGPGMVGKYWSEECADCGSLRLWEVACD